MTGKTCGCSSETCGCCQGAQVLTPLSTANRPGLDTLRYRVGTHSAFFETMKARLGAMTVEAPGADRQTLETFQPLRGFTTRDTSDPAIALLDSWATVGDVLTFYQERIANEGYLRTATERRSVLELARLVGYTPRPGVAATAFLAYTLDDNHAGPVEIPAGARSQSIPAPGELPQTFETSEELVARKEWNNLQVRRTQPQNITFETALWKNTIYVAGASVNLKTGDQLLLVFGDNGGRTAVRTVAKAESQFAEDRTEIQLQPVPHVTLEALPALEEFIKNAEPRTKSGKDLVGRGKEILNGIYWGLLLPPEEWVKSMMKAEEDGEVESGIREAFNRFQETLKASVKKPPFSRPAAVTTGPAQFVPSLLKSSVRQRRPNGSLASSFAKDSDPSSQLLVHFAPQLQDTYYAAWSNANVNDTPPALQAIYVLRQTAPLFGASVPKMATYDDNHELKKPNEWEEWPLANDETDDALFLDQANEALLPESYVLIDTRTPSTNRRTPGVVMRQVHQLTAAQTVQRTAYGISAKTTQLTLGESWWQVEDDRNDQDKRDSMGILRGTLVYAQSEELTLFEEPITKEVEGQEIALDKLYDGLTSGRWVIFSGERADIPGVTGVKASELLMISGLRHGYNKDLPGDKAHTTLILATSTAYSYKRDTLAIFGNVVKATHGETRSETLGSGEGSQATQSFVLKQPPLTFTPAPTPTGVESTLSVYVNDVEWHETDTFAGLGPGARQFITKTDDDAKTTVIFGNGKEGARLPTGVDNVKSVYRNGIGKSGNVAAEQISLLLTRPLGVNSVKNPLRASGGADKENRDQMRENAPLAVMSLDRLVSVQDYADFTRTFAGIGKAAARRLSDGRREVVHITIAGADDIPIDPVSDLYRNLLIALRKYGDPAFPVQVDARELLILILSAKVRLAPDYQWEPVVQKIRARVLDTFGFQKRALGQTVLLSEVMSLIQNTEGVAYVDIDAFGGIPEKKVDECDGKRRLLTLEELALTVKTIAHPTLASFLLAPSDLQNLSGFLKALLDEDSLCRTQVHSLWRQINPPFEEIPSVDRCAHKDLVQLEKHSCLQASTDIKRRRFFILFQLFPSVGRKLL